MRFTALLLFQWRVVVNGNSGVRRTCEQRMLCFKSLSARAALSDAKKRGKESEFNCLNTDGNRVHFEFMNQLTAIQFGAKGRSPLLRARARSRTGARRAYGGRLRQQPSRRRVLRGASSTLPQRSAGGYGSPPRAMFAHPDGDAMTHSKPSRSFLSGARIDPRPITGRETTAELIDNAFQAYNGARLREAAHLLTERMLADDVTVGLPIANLRWSIAHVPRIDAQTVARFKAIGAGIAVHPYTYLAGAPGAGPPLRTIVDSGIHVGAGSDSAQISTLDPWLMIYFMVTGKNAAGTFINEGQLLTRMEALRLYTSENGWFIREEDALGTIEPGKLGDVVVLTGDYFDAGKVPDEAIKRLKSAITIVGGRVVHDDARSQR